ncbi:TetR/AcrR family transcriptional regulator [Saccharomonospora iraqiensis]|uniref:TetR/AcrR family transcriptional regulator n=1 Tax=Saccharomonospora iraqiensis TaxID=52698 RepID=UPI00047EA5CD|nr:TetR/AcrR family transcriptional regulator [Saccharomonospora iraqiensis]
MSRGDGAVVGQPGPAGSDEGGDWRRYGALELTPLLSAALEAFYENGFHGTTVRDIARRHGQTVPSIYYHHQNKEGVFVALLEKATSDLEWRVRTAADDGGDRPDRRLAYVVEAVVLHMTRRWKLAALEPEQRHLSDRVRKRYARRRRDIERLVSDIVADGVRCGVFTTPHPEETARAVLGMCQFVGRWFRPGGSLTPEDVAARYADLALATAGSSCPAPSRPATS